MLRVLVSVYLIEANDLIVVICLTSVGVVTLASLCLLILGCMATVHEDLDLGCKFSTRPANPTRN